MVNRTLVLGLAAALALTGCGGGQSDEADMRAGESEAAPPPGRAVSTIEAPPGSDHTAEAEMPAEQTIPGAPLRATRRSFRLERLPGELEEPVYVASNPGEPNRLYVVERAGRLRVYEDGVLQEEPVLAIEGRVRTEIEEGFHSVAFHPDFPDDPRLYVDFNDRQGDILIVEYTVEGGTASPETARELLAIDKTDGVKWHNGGQLQFGPDGLLYVSVGDSARNPYDNLSGNRPLTADPENNAQNLELLFGKLIRLDVDAERPVPEIAAYGLRNTWRFSFDRSTGDLYLADVGQFATEELNVLPAGTEGLVNFGWSVFEGGGHYNDQHPLRGNGVLVWPVLQYAHGTGGLYCPERGSITGGYVYRGRAIPELRGRYVFGDYCSGEVWTTRVTEGRAVDTGMEHAQVAGLVSFGEDVRGELYAVSLPEAAVYRLVPR